MSEEGCDHVKMERESVKMKKNHMDRKESDQRVGRDYSRGESSQYRD